MIRRFWLAKVGGIEEIPGPEFYWMSDFDKWYPLYFYSLIINTENGYVIVGTGLVKDLTLRNEFMVKWSGRETSKIIVREDERIESVLRRLNLTPDDIAHVVITPVQDYTVGGLNLFKRAKIY
ncbi:MAG: Zn-dependent hydrolase, partial [Thermoproteota archaeon]